MKITSHIFSTNLTVKQLADIFRSANEPKGLIQKLGSRMTESEFYTPEAASNPFASVDGSDEPAFRVGYQVGLRQPKYRSYGGDMRNFMEIASQGMVELSVWDRGASRDVTIVHPKDVGGAGQFLRRLLKDIRAADASVSINTSTSRV